ncbi:unnamed protein product [Brassicogethes aeneus]|uniref:Histidine-rich glycoprotein n=1 Tax=Brassicogethes aeneus TaxID=1431903 RepID=A0A9P0BHE8_BRAAE|nr:unnamed protein product [Brassicogethes aeneus]
MAFKLVVACILLILGLARAAPGGWGHQVHHEHHLIHAPLYVRPEIVHVHEVEKVHIPVHIIKKVIIEEEPHHHEEFHHEHHHHIEAPIGGGGGWW